MDLHCILWSLFKGAVPVLIALVLLVLWDIRRRGYSTEIGWRDLFKLYAIRQLASIRTRIVTRKFDKDVRRFQEVQAEVLMSRIRRCENTAYGRDHGFSSIRSVDDFRRSQPITDYAAVQDNVKRVAEGEKSALLGEEDTIAMFLSSSGTTGKNKLIPVSAEATKDMRTQLLYGPFQQALRRDLEPWSLRRYLTVNNDFAVTYTKAGHVISAVSSVLTRSNNATIRKLYTTPPAGLQVKALSESYYIYALFALREKHINTIVGVFLHNLLCFMRRMEVCQKDLVNDVRRGRIKEDLDIPDDVRNELNAALKPMPERAREIEEEFAKGFKSIVARLWPDIKAVRGLWSGSTNEIYYKEAKEYVGPDIVIVSFTYSASEGFMGSNRDCTRPGAPRYTLLPDCAFFEFLPIVNDHIPDLEDINPKDLLLSTELQLNTDYEVILTNKSGFYRYRVGDVIRVVGFYQQAPQVEFLYRSGQALNAGAEKLSEEVFFRALREAADSWPSTLKDHTVVDSELVPDKKTHVEPHYVLFVEVDGEPLTEEHTGMVDEMLQQKSEQYSTYRKLKRMSKLRVHQVPRGTFSEFREHLLETTAVAASQFKMPRVLKSSDKVEWFMKRVRN